MHHRPVRRTTTLGIGALATLLLLTGCGDGDAAAPSSSTAAPASSAAVPTDAASADVPTADASPAVTGIPLETAVPSSTPSTAESPGTSTGRATSADGVFSAALPAGATEVAGTFPAGLSTITMNRAGNGNLVIGSLRYSTPRFTVTRWFDSELDGLKNAFPSCTFPRGADVIGEELGDGADANSRAFTCDAFPGTFTIFTANGPDGELLAGHDQDYTGAGQDWKQVVRSVRTLKKP